MLKNDIRQISMNSAISNYIGKAIMAAIDAALFILVTKKLAVNDYGVYSFLIAILTFFAFFASLGIPYALLRFIPEYMENGKRNMAAGVIRLSFYILAGFGCLLLICSFFAADRISFIFKVEPLRKLFPLVVTIGTLYIIARSGEEILNALFMQVYRNACQAAAALLKLAAFIAILYRGFGIGWLLVSVAIITALQVLAYFVKIYAYLPETRSPGLMARPELRRFYIFSSKEYLYVVTAFFWDISLDIYIITYLLGSANIGFFNFAASIGLFLFHWSPGIVLQSVISPLFVKEHAKRSDADSLEKLFQFYNKCKAFFAFPVIFGVWLLIGRFEHVFYQDKFAPAVPVLNILIISVMLQAFTIPIRNIFNIFEKNEFSLYSNIVVVYRVCASFIFITRYGIIGAAYAYGSSMALYLFIHLFFLRRLVKIRYPLKSFLKILVNSLVMALSLEILKCFTGNTLGWLVALAASAALVYFAASYINKPFIKEERGLIIETLRGAFAA